MFAGNEDITITGTNLPSPATYVRLGTKLVQVLSSTSTELRIRSPSLAPGMYDLLIPKEDLGNARYF